MADKCLLELIAYCAGTVSVKEIVFLQMNDGNEYSPAVRDIPPNLLRPMIQQLAGVAPERSLKSCAIIPFPALIELFPKHTPLPE